MQTQNKTAPPFLQHDAMNQSVPSNNASDAMTTVSKHSSSVTVWRETKLRRVNIKIDEGSNTHTTTTMTALVGPDSALLQPKIRRVTPVPPPGNNSDDDDSTYCEEEEHENAHVQGVSTGEFRTKFHSIKLEGEEEDDSGDRGEGENDDKEEDDDDSVTMEYNTSVPNAHAVVSHGVSKGKDIKRLKYQHQKHTFPQRLEVMLREVSESHPHLMSWTKDGSGFYIQNTLECNGMIKKYFKHGRFDSLRRQLNVYGFCRENKGVRSGAKPFYGNKDKYHRDKCGWKGGPVKVRVFKPKSKSKSKRQTKGRTSAAKTDIKKKLLSARSLPKCVKKVSIKAEQVGDVMSIHKAADKTEYDDIYDAGGESEFEELVSFKEERAELENLNSETRMDRRTPHHISQEVALGNSPLARISRPFAQFKSSAKATEDTEPAQTIYNWVEFSPLQFSGLKKRTSHSVIDSENTVSDTPNHNHAKKTCMAWSPIDTSSDSQRSHQTSINVEQFQRLMKNTFLDPERMVESQATGDVKNDQLYVPLLQTDFSVLPNNDMTPFIAPRSGSTMKSDNKLHNSDKIYLKSESV